MNLKPSFWLIEVLVLVFLGTSDVGSVKNEPNLSLRISEAQSSHVVAPRHGLGLWDEGFMDYGSRFSALVLRVGFGAYRA